MGSARLDQGRGAVATAVRERAALVTGDPDLRPLAGTGALDLEWIGA